MLKIFAYRELDLGYTISPQELDDPDSLARLSDYIFVSPRFKFALAHVDGRCGFRDEDIGLEISAPLSMANHRGQLLAWRERGY